MTDTGPSSFCTNCGEPIDGTHCDACGSDTRAGATPDGATDTDATSATRWWIPVLAVLAILALGIGAFLLARSGGDEDDESVLAEETTTTTSTTIATTTTSIAAPSTIPAPTFAPDTTTTIDQVALAHRQFTTIAALNCDLTMIPDPELSVLENTGGGTFYVTDVEGNNLLFHQTSRTVTSTDGPDGVMPRAYSFGCDPTVFVGTLDH